MLTKTDTRRVLVVSLAYEPEKVIADALKAQLAEDFPDHTIRIIVGALNVQSIEVPVLPDPDEHRPKGAYL